VTFSPTAAGNVNRNLNMFAGTTSLTVPLSGTGGTVPQLVINPSSLSFGNVTVGTTASQTGTLTAMNASVTITSATFNSSEFTLSGLSLPYTLAANQSVSFTVTFAPLLPGGVSASLSFVSNAGNSPASQGLSGTGTAPPIYKVGLTWDPASGDIIGYNIYRGITSGGPYTKLNATPDGGTSYVDYQLQYSTTYYYVTTSVGSDGSESAYSNQTTAVIPPL
jgi:hypothetical protein